MPSNFKTPGVYIQEISKFPPSIAQVETAIPAFVGYTQKARKKGEDILFEPTRITSLLEYEQFFGTAKEEEHIIVTIDQNTDGAGNVTEEVINAKFNRTGDAGPSKHLMYYSMQLFFANGGGPCYIVSIGTYFDDFTTAINYDSMKQGLDTLEKEDEVTLFVFPEGQGMLEVDYYTLCNDALSQCNKLQDRFLISDIHNGGRDLVTSGDVIDAIAPMRNTINNSTDFSKYGASYFPNLMTILDYVYDESTVLIEHHVDGGDNNGSLNGTLMPGLDSATTSKVRGALSAFPLELPSSPAVAGVYARVDGTRGVWKAPANESLLAISGLHFKVTDDIQDFLNVDVVSGKSINAIRNFVGRGTLVWGARTLAGNDNEWRYVSVRRFFNMVEESVKKATNRFVFDPNDANTWVKVRAMIENFLVLQWRAGALAGPTPESAFYVKVGLGETMTPLDVLEGRMIVEIGMAVVRPAEFIILRFSHKMQEA